MIFNGFHHGSYWLALKHKFEGKALNFLPIEVVKDGVTFEMMMPTF